MLWDTIFRMVLVALACVGFVHTAAWAGIRMSCKGGRTYRVFPIGGKGKDTGRQMSMMYACLQWESNPGRQVYILYDAGLDEQGVRDCTELARGAGLTFVRSPDELAALLR